MHLYGSRFLVRIERTGGGVLPQSRGEVKDHALAGAHCLAVW